MRLKSFYYLAFIFYFVCAFAYTYHNYQITKQDLLKSIDVKLLDGADSVPILLPPHYFRDDINGKISAEEDYKNIKEISKEAKLLGVDYIYALIKEGDKVVYAVSSATEKEIADDKNIRYFKNEYKNPSLALQNVFGSKDALFDSKSVVYENKDTKDGLVRVVYVPQKSQDGTVYILCADMKMDFVQEKLNGFLLNSLYEIIFFTAILIPLFLSYFLHNKSVNRTLELMNRSLEIKVKERTEQVKTLLNNADQGFLSFSSDMIVHGEYSQKCIEFFKKKIAGENISNLLFANEVDRLRFTKVLISLVGDEDHLRVETILSLLQKEFVINDKIISAEYKMVGFDVFMIVLTDITEKVALEKRLDKERKTLKMVVSAVAYPNEFFELIEDYQEFINNKVALINERKTPTYNLSELYRMVHTYKGNFAQKDFITTPQGLHKLETKLSTFLSDANTTNEDLMLIMQKVDLLAWLKKDLDVLKQILGECFFEDKEKITINPDAINGLKEKIKLNAISLGVNDEALEDIMLEVDSLKLKPLADMLSSYPKLVKQIAQKLEKSVYPTQIVCDRKICLGDEYRPFIRSLVHIFRNSVDHGLESADDRVENGKDEYGTISCVVNEELNGYISILIADDGAGINLDSVAKKAIQNGLCTPEEIEVMSEEEIAMLIFSDNFSTKDEVSELSGRGVGLFAVKAELERIGGFMRISTKSGVGATFTFYLTKHDKKKENV